MIGYVMVGTNILDKSIIFYDECDYMGVWKTFHLKSALIRACYICE